MSPQTKYTVSHILTVIVSTISVLTFVVGATAMITEKFHENTKDHHEIHLKLEHRKESDTADRKMIVEMDDKLDEINDNQIQIMTRLNVKPKEGSL
jgi:hypothetical protein